MTQSVSRSPVAGAVEAPAARSGKLNSDMAQFWIGLAFILSTAFVPEMLGNRYWTHVFLITDLFIAAAILQNLLLVDAGQASFGQGAVFGLGAYMTGIASGLHNLPFGWAILFGVVAASLGGLLLALPALRVQHFHLGFVTLSAAIVVPEMIVAANTWTQGVSGIPMKLDYLLERGSLGISVLSVLVAVVGAASLALHVGIRRTRLGRSMLVAAVSAEGAQSLGISPGLMRFIAFMLAGTATGLVGTLYPPIVGFVSPSAFNLELSILFFFAVIVGGRGQILGPVIGIWLLYFLPNVLLAQFVNYKLLIYGFVTLLVMAAFPDGIVGSIERWRRGRLRQSDGRRNLRVDQMIAEYETALPGSTVVAKSTTPAIEVRGGCRSFGRVVALDNVDITVVQGEIHGLIGANGSGKTSLLNVLSGFSRLDKGTLRVDGVDITRLPAHRIARLGIGRTFQTPRIFADLSVWDNLQVGLDARQNRGAGRLPATVEALRAALSEQSAEWLPHGQRRLVEVLRVVLKEASILLLDEPAAGLSPDERREFAELLRHLSRRMGKTVVLVEHDLDLVWGTADRLTVLDTGRVVAVGTPAEVAKNPAARPLFVGSKHA